MMKVLETSKGYILLAEFEETETSISAKTSDMYYIEVQNVKKHDITGKEVIEPIINLNPMFPNMFGIMKSTYSKSNVIIQDLNPESTLVKEINRIRSNSKIEVISAPVTGNKVLDKKILTGDIKK
jgi:hypothetical protein